jgi:hypothetical protein
MARQRKTRDYWEVRGYYAHGWECVISCEAGGRVNSWPLFQQIEGTDDHR